MVDSGPQVQSKNVLPLTSYKKPRRHNQEKKASPSSSTVCLNHVWLQVHLPC